MSLYARIIVSINTPEVDRLFTYAIPDALLPLAKPGMRCIAPFGAGNRQTEGYILEVSDACGVPLEKVKALASIVDEKPVFSERMISLALWMKDKYYTTLAGCLNAIMPPGLKNKAEQSALVVYIRYAELTDYESAERAAETVKNPRQRAVIAYLIEKAKGGNKEVPISEIKTALDIPAGPIVSLEKKGLLRIFETQSRRSVVSRETQSSPHTLTGEQQSAFDFIMKTVDGPPPKKPVLIHGVTGSGKTEVYLWLINEAIYRRKQAIVLVPEISLTPQTVQSFIDRFGDVVSVTHSKMSAGERLDQWKKARDNEIQVMVGPRSAIFTPFDNLGVIIIDEEHEHTYKSETSPKYYVKDVALKLSEMTGATVVMGSATPSVETYYEAKQGKIDLIRLTERVNKKMPVVAVKDMRLELAAGNRSIFSSELIEAIGNNIKNREQTILFLNRRGFSTFVSCRNCGYVMACERCSINYTYHKYNKKLMCHYCGAVEKTPERCPVCASPHIKFFGAGTQKIEQEVNTLFPEAVTLRMDYDTTGRKNAHSHIIKQFSDKKADILIGTQMIAKGLNFPDVSLVGIVAADISLNNGDFKSAETTFQLLTQVSGRAGRAETLGKVIIQTYNPEHYAVVYAKTGDYESFYEHEIAIRRQMLYPPFSHLFSILMTGEKERDIIVLLYKLLDIMRFYNKKGRFELLGPAPATISKINNNYRWKIIIKCVDEERIKNYALYCVDKLKTVHGVTEGISISLSLDPSMLP